MASLYIRNVPDELYNWLKKEAKERGITLRQLLIDLLDRARQMDEEKRKLEWPRH